MRKVKVKTEYGEEVRYYLKPDEALKYSKLGFNVKQGPRGGYYITEQDFIAGKKKLREKHPHEPKEIKDDEDDNLLDELLDKLKQLYKEGKYKEALDVLYDIRSKFGGKLDEDELEYLDVIEDKIVMKGSNDVLGIELCKVVNSTKKYVYKRVCNKLGVLSKFKNIDEIEYLGDNKYSIKLGNDLFEIKYDNNGTASEIWYYDSDSGKKYKGRRAVIKWLSKSKGKELENIWEAFAKKYGVTEKKRGHYVIEINRKNALIDKIELVKPSGRRGNPKFRWLLFVMIKARELGIAVKDISDVIKLMNSDGLKQLILEMFSVTE